MSQAPETLGGKQRSSPQESTRSKVTFPSFFLSWYADGMLRLAVSSEVQVLVND